MNSDPITLGGVEFDAARFLGRRLLVQGASGAGKSETLRLIYERAPADFLQIIIDTEDEFHTLRAPGRDYAILGGPYADVAGLRDMPWQALAETILKMGSNVIFQLNEWGLDDQRAFISEFIGGLMSAPRTLWRPVLIGLDETDLYAPNGSAMASEKAITFLAKAGRKRGYSACFATQRMSALSPDVRAQCENILIGRINSTLDKKAACEILGFTPSSQDARTFKTMEPGVFWGVGPALHLPNPEIIYLDRAETKAPSPGIEAPPAAPPEAILKALAGLPKASKEEPADAAKPQSAADMKAAEMRGFNKGFQHGFNTAKIQASELLANVINEIRPPASGGILAREDGPYLIGEQISSIEVKLPDDPLDVQNIVTSCGGSPGNVQRVGGELTAGAKALFNAFLAVWPRAITMTAAAKLSGRSVRSSAFPKSVRELEARVDLIECVGDRWKVVDAWAKGASVPKLSRAQAVDALCATLSPTASAMLRVLDHHGIVDSFDHWAELAGVSPTSSGVRKNFKDLEGLGMATLRDDGKIAIHDDLKMMEGADD